MTEKYADLARKIKALADSTEFEGEREAALKKLDLIMTKYGISESDLHDDVLGDYTFNYSTEYEERLILQVSYKVIGNRDFKTFGSYRNGRKKRSTIIRCTPSQRVEIEFLYDFYKRLYRKEKEIFEDAFIQKHRLFGIPTDGKGTTIDNETWEKMCMYSGGMSSDTPHKQIERKGDTT
jgi:hypothetical protein